MLNFPQRADALSSLRNFNFSGLWRSQQKESLFDLFCELTRAPKVITLDGTNGSGKSTLAASIAAHFGLDLLDTGAMYRAVAYEASKKGIAFTDRAALGVIAEELKFEFLPSPHKHVSWHGKLVLVNGADITQEMLARRGELGKAASIVAEFPEVRAPLVEIQRRLGRKGCVTTGRDQGTEVFYDAPIKLWVEAQANVVAKRTGMPAHEVIERDRRDRERTVAPLREPANAIKIDTSHLSTRGVRKTAINFIEERLRTGIEGMYPAKNS